MHRKKQAHQVTPTRELCTLYTKHRSHRKKASAEKQILPSPKGTGGAVNHECSCDAVYSADSRYPLRKQQSAHSKLVDPKLRSLRGPTMGSYHYASTSQFVFAAVDSNPKPAAAAAYRPKTTVQIPIMSPSEEAPDAEAAAKIQAAFRGHLVRRHVAAVRSADAEATRLERLLRRQETVDAVRGDERERARFSETLMAALLRLDAVPGYYPAVRDARRAVSRRVVGLQEVFDAVVAAPEAQTCGVPASLEQVIEGIWGAGEPTATATAPVEQRRRGSCWGRFFGGA